MASRTASCPVKIVPLVKRANRAYLRLLLSPACFNSAVSQLLTIVKLAQRARDSRTRNALIAFITKTLVAIRFCILTLPKTFGLRELSHISLYLQAI